jgi:hypothetical protein
LAFASDLEAERFAREHWLKLTKLEALLIEQSFGQILAGRSLHVAKLI